MSNLLSDRSVLALRPSLELLVERVGKVLDVQYCHTFTPKLLHNGGTISDVSRQMLAPKTAKLLEELSRRAEWSVYFEADSDTLSMDTVYAMDTRQDCGAKLIWVTPKLREEWRHKEQSVREGRGIRDLFALTLFGLHCTPNIQLKFSETFFAK